MRQALKIFQPCPREPVAPARRTALGSPAVDRAAETSGHILRRGPEQAELPVLLSVPHAGRDYPLALRARLAVPLARLEALEDRHADLLVDRACAEGATALIAARARCWIDLNRDPREVDPAMIDPSPPAREIVSTMKVRGGLGLIPRYIAGTGDILRGRLTADELAARIAGDHRPWHAAIDTALAQRRARFGAALLLDCHSMPALCGSGAAQVVIGDRHGRSAAPLLVERAITVARAAGLTVALNAPYPGGYTSERHGRPQYGVHAIQIELDRALYLAPNLRDPGPGMAAMQALIARIAAALAEELGASALPLAAE